MSSVARQANAGKLGDRKPEEHPGISNRSPQYIQQVDLGGMQSPRHGSVIRASDDFLMAAACATRLPHHRPGRDVAVGPRLLIREGKRCLFRS